MPAPHPVLGERIARHGFTARPACSVADAAARACGVQAQDGPASRLGVRARAAGVTDADVLAAIADRSVVRTWLMRTTIHLVAAVDVRWLRALLGPMIRRRFETVRWPQLGLTAPLLEAAMRAAPQVLACRALGRHEFATGRTGYRLGEVPAERGVRLLPAFDNYLVGYADRPFIAPERRGEVYVGGVIRPTVLVDGRVAGRWRLVKGTVEITEFERYPARIRAALEAEVADVSRFLGGAQ